MNNLEIKLLLEKGQIDNLLNEEIKNWIFSEAEHYHTENKEFKKKRGFPLPYTGVMKLDTTTNFSGAIPLWAQDYSLENKLRMQNIAQLTVNDLIEKNDKFVTEEYPVEIIGFVRRLSWDLDKLKRSSNPEIKEEASRIKTSLRESLKDLYQIYSPNAKAEINNGILMALVDIDPRNQKKYLSQLER